MPASQKDQEAPKFTPPSEDKRRETPPVVGEPTFTAGESPSVALTLNNSSRRCLNAAGITNERLEVLSTLDFKPLTSGKNETLAGRLLELRVIERNADLESVKSLLAGAASADLITKYDSVLTAAESEFALLKILILMQKYATHTARFLPFINEYDIPDGLDLSFLGDTNLEILQAVLAIDLEQGIENSQATRLLIQFLLMLNCSTIAISPFRLSNDVVSLKDNDKVINRIVASDSAFGNVLYNLAYMSRDLTFSREMTRIRDDIEPDEDYMQLIKDTLGTSFANSSREITDFPTTAFIGTNAFTNCRRNLNNQNQYREKMINGYLSSNQGIMSKLRMTFQRQPILLAETSEIKYSAGEFSTIQPIVDKAFEGPKTLDFTKYSEVIDDFVKSIKDAETFGKTSFRLLDKASDSDGKPMDLSLISDEQPLSMASVTTITMDTFNRRFASTLKTSLYSSFSDWLTPEHISYTRIFSWMIIRDDPALAKKIFRHFLEDYNAGFLTVAGLPEPIEDSAELDSDGNEIEGTERMSALINVKPGTDTVANLTGRSTSLNSSLKSINEYFSGLRQALSDHLLSGNIAEGVSYPELRVSHNLGDSETSSNYFGDTNNEGNSEADLRLINVIYMNQITKDWSSGTTKESENNIYLSNKIIAAEVIDSVLEVLRLLTTQFTDVLPAEDGDPVFPYVDQIRGPYGQDGSSNWAFSGAGYEQFSMNQWVSTCNQWDDLFTRSSTKTTYFRRSTLKDYGYKIIDVFNYLMQQYDFIEPRMETFTSDYRITKYVNSTKERCWRPVVATIRFVPTEVRKSGWEADGNGNIALHINTLSGFFDDFFDSNFDDFEGDVDDINRELPRGIVETITTGVTATGYGGRNEGDFMDVSKETYVPPVPPSQPALEAWSQLLLGAKQEDMILSFLYDFLGQYGSRVENYKNATLDLISGAGTPLGELIDNLTNAGDAGTDILQNLSVNQMALKQIAIEEEPGDPENGYLPKLSILNESEINAVKILCNEPILNSPEGDTTRVIIVGIPVGSFDKNQIDSNFCLRLSYRDIEYPQLVFKSKSFTFDKDLYVLPDDLENMSTASSSFTGVINNMTFSKVIVKVEESNDTSASIELIDSKTKIGVDDGENRDVYVNLAVSEVLKIYYRIMLGLNFSESTFQSTPGDLSIPISESSASLAESLAGQIESISSYASGLATNITSLLTDVTKFENMGDFITGDIEPVDKSLLGDLKNAYQSRLMSPETMRSRIISAKMFDRIYALPVDPDEFYIVAPGNAEVGDIETPEEIFDFYLQEGIIEMVTPGKYKLVARKSAEGTMAMGSVTVAMTSLDDTAETVLEL